jgi:2,4-dienoyl-CoA reductase-like NADH-dependent reductase (Old Yellow Enzyme family)
MTTTPLADPVTFRGGTTAANRCWLAPLTNHAERTTTARSRTLERLWLERRAAGGFGLVETCAAHVSEDGKGFDGQLGVWGDHQLPGLRALAAGLAARGALGLVQLYHGGVRSPSRLIGQQPWSASSFDEAREGFERPRPATDADLERAIATSSPRPLAPARPASPASSCTARTATCSRSSSAGP